ncbi:MAG: hypothetical protein ACRDLT_13140 [Solirubrobacteraceae bacterium]
MSGPEDSCARAGDASLYVLGELYGRRGESFVRHLRRCEECTEEVSLLQQVAGSEPLLGEAYMPPEEEADPGRRARTPTLTVAAANARAARLAAEQAAADGTRRPPIEPPARPVLRTIQGGADRRPPRGFSIGRRLLKTPMPRSVLISFIALGVLAVATVAMTSRAASVRYFRIQAGWSKGGAALKLVGNQLELLVEDMPKPANGTGYQVWVVNRGTKRPIPTSVWVHLNRLHQGGVSVPGDYHDWDAIAVYVEPLTGKRTTHSGAAVVGDLRDLE